jgi:hypothetical protein
MSYIRPRGLGASDSAIASQAGGVLSPVVSTVGGSAAATALGVSASLAIPIVGAAFAGLMIGIEALLNSGCGQTCVETSEWANQASAQLDQLIAAYFGVPAPRPQSLQTTYLQLFQQIWNTLVSQCSQPNLGTAGQNCISDRQDGACKWKAAAPAYPGEPAAGTCWNWWNAYYWPVANDPNVVPDAQLQTPTPANAISAVTGSGTSVAAASSDTGVTSVPTWAWLVAAALVVWAVA